MAADRGFTVFGSEGSVGDSCGRRRDHTIRANTAERGDTSSAQDSTREQPKALPSLTASQRRVLSTVERYLAKHGFPPSHQDLCDLLGFRSTKATFDALRILDRKGYVSISSRRSRGLRVLVGSNGRPFGAPRPTPGHFLEPLRTACGAVTFSGGCPFHAVCVGEAES